MRYRTLLWACIAIICIIAGYALYPERTITHPSGILIPSAPAQSALPQPKSWEKEGYTIDALAAFHIDALVLSRKNYSSGRESDLSPVDLALGWNRMSDQQVVDQIKFSQHSRWYFWKVKVMPIPRSEIESSSANMHIIPADEEVESVIESIVKGNVIHIDGYLVAAHASDGWKWKSSMTRNDTGHGACEIIYVERVSVDPEE